MAYRPEFVSQVEEALSAEVERLTRELKIAQANARAIGTMKELGLEGSSVSKRERKLSTIIHNQRAELARVIQAKDKAWNRAIREAAAIVEQGNAPDQVARRARILSLLRKTGP